MTQKLLQHFNNLTIWKRDDERAPHKPLLALWAIGRCLRGKSRLVKYDIAHNALVDLLENFGPPRSNHKPQEPFWRMQKDNIWKIPQHKLITVQPNGSVSPSDLREHSIRGGFPKPIFDLFRREKIIAFKVAKELVAAHFPRTMHKAVLRATLGEDVMQRIPSTKGDIDDYKSPLLKSVATRRNRDAKFRKEILMEYDFRCAVCEYYFEFPNGYWPALEAAHIKWHSHYGPDEAANGLSLCVLHHELFDWGAFTILPNSLKIMVATQIVKQAPGKWLTRFHKTELPVKPKQKSALPAKKYLDWHARNVFRDAHFIQN